MMKKRLQALLSVTLSLAVICASGTVLPARAVEDTTSSPVSQPQTDPEGNVWAGESLDAGGTYTMAGPVTISGNVKIAAGVVINTDGKTITVPAGASLSLGGEINGTVTVTGGTLTASGSGNGLAVQLQGGVFDDRSTNPVVPQYTSGTYQKNGVTQYQIAVKQTTGGSVTASQTGWVGSGSTVTFTAAAEQGYRFAGWNGLTGSETTATLTVTGDAEISARFEQIPTVQDITITAEESSPVQPGGTRQFTARVTMSDGSSQEASGGQWSVTGERNVSATTIDQNGLLKVAANETAASLTVQYTQDGQTNTLTVRTTPAWDGATINTTGNYIVNRPVTINSAISIRDGAVVTVESGGSITVASGGTLTLVGQINGTVTINGGTFNVAGTETDLTVDYKSGIYQKNGVRQYQLAAAGDIQNGSVTVPEGWVSPEELITITTIPDSGYQTSTVTVQGSKNLAKPKENTYTMTLDRIEGLESAPTVLTVDATFIPEVIVTGMTLTPSTATVNRGGTLELTAVLTGQDINAHNVTWQLSGNTSASTKVEGEANGHATLTVGVDEAASALTITATSTENTAVKATAKVTVPAASLTITPASATVQKGNSFQFTANATGYSGTVDWSVTGANGSVTSGTRISSGGLLTVASGETNTTLTVTAKLGDKTATAAVTVSDTAVDYGVIGVTVTASGGVSWVRKGQSLQLAAQVLGKNPPQGVTWSVDGTPAGVTIDQNGLLTVDTTATVTQVVVYAVSTADNTKAGQYMLTVLAQDAKIYQLTVTAGSGGDVNAVSGQYPAGTQVRLSADPDSGYVFRYWEITSGTGTLGSRYATNTTFTVGEGDATVRAVFRKRSSGSGSDRSSFEERQSEFWYDLLDEIEDAKSGTTIRVNAGSYDQLPTYILTELKGQDITLEISHRGGKTFSINGLNMLPIPSNQVYYLLDDLEELYEDIDPDGSGAGGTDVPPPTSLPDLEISAGGGEIVYWPPTDGGSSWGGGSGWGGGSTASSSSSEEEESSSSEEEESSEPSSEEEAEPAVTEPEEEEGGINWLLVLGITAAVVVIAAVGIAVFLKRRDDLYE